jgi:hypothetical protein
MTVFLVSGLWHGANWTFVAWGAVHGLGLIVSDLFSMSRVSVWVRRVLTFHFVSFAWIFFRANSLSDAFLIIRRMGSDFSNWRWEPVWQLMGRTEFGVAVLLIVVLFVFKLFEEQGSVWRRLEAKSVWIRWSCYYSGVGAFVLALLVRARDLKPQQFIYFQF